jgi:sec-independent protein translocase protein TatA
MFRNPLIDAAVVLLAVLLIFGPKRLPQLGRSLGHGMREFKDGITGQSTPEDEERPELTQASAPPAQPVQPQPAAESVPAPPAAAPPAAAPAEETFQDRGPEVGSAERRS